MHISFIPQSYQDWSEDDLAVWMKAVNIDAYLGLFQAGGVVRGCDLVGLDEEQLRRMDEGRQH